MQSRPVYINIFTFAFPITAIISILHRISGVVVFVCIPQLLGSLQNMLYAPWVASRGTKITMWIALCALIYHLFAGIRHLCMDAGLGEDKDVSKLSSYIVLLLTILFSAIVGFYLW